MATVDTSFLNAFYPEESLEISNVIQEKDNILIQMKSVTVCCTCPKCGQTTNNYHGRASAYARVIAEELPDAMQVADRFHLHQNLLEAIKKALNKEIPATITIPHAGEDSCKKNRS